MSVHHGTEATYPSYSKQDAIVATSSGRDEIMDELNAKGAVIFEEFISSLDHFIEFSDRFTKAYVPYVGGANNGRATVGKSVYTVTEPSMKMPIPLHGEMYYSNMRPDLLWFYCVTPPVANGETTLCDGRAIYENLTPAIRQAFEAQDVVYIRNFSEKVWQNVYQTDKISDVKDFCKANKQSLTVHPDGSITTRFQASAIVTAPGGKAFINSVMTFAAQEYIGGSKESQIRWADGSELDMAMIWEVKAIADGLTVAHPWKAGDLIMVDNTRVMHGRRAFKDDQRNIVVRLGMRAD